MKIDKRKRLKKNIYNTIIEIIDIIKPILKKKQINLNFNNDELQVEKRIFVSDFESILYNLIINSMESFERKSRKSREISISITNQENGFCIFYSDNGYGLEDNFKDPYEIFEYGVSSKISRDGDNIGTGLGMYIISSTVREYDGEIKIIDFKDKFSLNIFFPN